jgi:hypothetical protein
MNQLRGALATAIRDIAWNAYFRLGDPSDKVPDSQDCADAILSDPAFRLALTESIAEALASEDWSSWSTAGGWDDLAAAIVARMLGATE